LRQRRFGRRDQSQEVLNVMGFRKWDLVTYQQRLEELLCSLLSVKGRCKVILLIHCK